MNRHKILFFIHVFALTALFVYVCASCGHLERKIDILSQSSDICKMRDSRHRCILYNINNKMYDQDLLEIKENVQ